MWAGICYLTESPIVISVIDQFSKMPTYSLHNYIHTLMRNLALLICMHTRAAATQAPINYGN